MYTFKITNVETAYSQADNSHFIDVQVEIYKGEELADTRRFGFPLGTTKDEILEHMEKLCVTLASDEEIGVKSLELEKQLADAESLKTELLSPDKGEEE